MTVEDYIRNLDSDARKDAVQKLRDVILKNIPQGFEETINYGVISYVVPHSIYPKGYHCNPQLPLPFLSIAAQKKFIALYHMGIYADKSLMEWWVAEFPKHCDYKLDMGKSCVRFKKLEKIPYALIGQLVQKMEVQEWIQLYEKQFRKS